MESLANGICAGQHFDRANALSKKDSKGKKKVKKLAKNTVHTVENCSVLERPLRVCCCMMDARLALASRLW